MALKSQGVTYLFIVSLVYLNKLQITLFSYLTMIMFLIVYKIITIAIIAKFSCIRDNVKLIDRNFRSLSWNDKLI